MMTASAGAAIREILWVIAEPMAVIVILHRRSNGFLRQNRTVQLMGRQTAQRLGDCLVGELQCL